MVKPRVALVSVRYSKYGPLACSAQWGKEQNVDVKFVKHETWAEVVLNRPDVKNAIYGPLGLELAKAFEAAQSDDDIQVVLFRGAGGAFCSGLDLKAFSAKPSPPWMKTWKDTWRRAHRAIFDCSKPIVCALERFAINGGAALAIASDFCICGEEAFLSVGEVKLGMAAPYNLVWLRLKHSESVTARLALLGERVHGPQLLELGVVTECVADETVESRARAFAEHLAAYPPGALSRIKRTSRALANIDIEAHFDVAIQHAQGGAKPPPKRS